MRISIYLLCIAQAATITVAVLSVTISPTLGKVLSGQETWATIPYGIQFLALLVATLPIATLSLRFGRKPTLAIAAIVGMVGCLTSSYAIYADRFILFVLAQACIGIGICAGNYYRFCALELSDQSNKPIAMSLVMSAGVAAALLGPSISRLGWSFEGISVYSVMYLIAAGLFLLSGTAVLLANIPMSASRIVILIPKRIKTNEFPKGWILGILSGSIGYFFMNFLMIEYPMHLMSAGMSLHTMSYMIELHVLGMFLPSFFSGFLIKKLGCRSVITAGSSLLILAAIFPVMNNVVMTWFLAMIMLGVAWNFLYISGSYLVSLAADPKIKSALQGRNEFVVGLSAMAGAFLPGVSVGLGGLVLGSCLAIGSGLMLVCFALGGNSRIIMDEGAKIK